MSTQALAQDDATATRLKEDAAAFVREVEALQSTADDFRSGKITKDRLRLQFTNTRLAYKRVEFMLEYYYPEHIKAYINGAPLPHLDPYPYEELPLPDAYYRNPGYINVAPLDHEEPNAHLKPREVLDPEGLQALDEIVSADDAGENKAKIAALTRNLSKRSRIVVQALRKRRFIEDYQVLEAARLELVRVFTLGLTGFDTPGSLNALEEARATFASLSSALQPMLGRLPKPERAAIERSFSLALSLLDRQTFDGFDRLGYLMRVVNPLYRQLGQAHRTLNLKFSRDLTHEISAWNVDSQNLFGNDFLNPYAFTVLQAHEDSDALRALGKKLFHDERLSRSEALSCASCHVPEKSFADAAPKPPTLHATPNARNAPSLINAVLADRFFYDLRAYSLEEQITGVVENPAEFDTRLEDIAAKVSRRSDYRSLVKNAFGEDALSKPVTRYRVLAALTSYVVSLRSFESPFDRYVRGETGEIAPEVIKGFNLFMGKAACGTCHYAPTFAGLVPPLFRENETEVLGVLAEPGAKRVDSDRGRAANRQFQEDAAIFERAFKTVTVRNVELTAPYFHNGAYRTLDEVIDFYDQGGAQGVGLGDQVPNQTLPAEPLNLTDGEKAALKAFMLSLTDRKAIGDRNSGIAEPRQQTRLTRAR